MSLRDDLNEISSNTAVMGSALIEGITAIADIARYHMNRGIESDRDWHAHQEDDQVFVVLEIALPKSSAMPLFVEIDNNTAGVMTGIRIPVGTTADFPKLYGGSNEDV